MNKVTIGITLLLCIVASWALWFLSCSTELQLSDNERVSLYISIIACLGALISATFVVFSYLQTNNAYVEAQRPHLLVQIENLVNSETNNPISRIHYSNITNNRFDDLTIQIKVKARNSEYNLSELFRAKMTMIGRDQRQRNFDPQGELNKLGLDLQSTSEEGNEVKLTVSYQYTFNNKTDNVSAQMYLWTAKRKEWEIC